MLQYDRRTPIYGYEIPSGVPRGVSDAVSLILAHLVYQFIEVFVHRHCTGHYPISGRSGIESPLRICCLIGYYHNTAFILWAKIRKRFESCRTLNHYFSTDRGDRIGMLIFLGHIAIEGCYLLCATFPNNMFHNFAYSSLTAANVISRASSIVIVSWSSSSIC